MELFVTVLMVGSSKNGKKVGLGSREAVCEMCVLQKLIDIWYKCDGWIH